ncbi:MAG: hypothetical protein EOM64_06500 [Erysipelotrichia bacterium]|nr:hypothetical protein [Erysipelotrichia bacterium]
MTVCGITAEYNPFHSGHAWQISEARRLSGCDVMISVMSGNFVQRGEPAVIDKWKRAETACRNGIDLVLELPYYYAVQSAARFAHGAVSILKLAGCNCISFGSECANLENLQEIAETPINPDHLHQSMDTGMSFPRAYSLLTSEMRPNDILAVAYLKEIVGTDIRPIVIPRTTSYLDTEIHGNNASAMAVRTALRKNQPISDVTPMAAVLEQCFHPWMELYWPYLRTMLLTTSPERLSEFFLFSEGIENHLIEHAKTADTWQEFLNGCTNWRYTSSRIRRTVLSAMNQFTKKEAEHLPQIDCLRVLACSSTGRKYLHDMRKNESVRFASRFAAVPYPWRQLEYRTTLMYSSVFPSDQRQILLEREIGGASIIE